MTETGDDTVPTGRAGVDPLIAYPLESSGLTGEIERPGDQTPWWFIPGMFAVALGFIGLLVYISQTRSGDAATATSLAPVEQSAPAAGGGPATDVAPVAGSDPVSTAAGSESAPTTVDPRIAELPPPGTVRVGGADYAVVARCEVHLPFDPVDTSTQVSSYFFFDDNGERGLVERFVDNDSDTAIRLLGGIQTSSTELVEIGDAGAFAASFVGGEVVVNPMTAGEPQCGDRVVTNAPGQFAEAHTRIILDVCVDTGGPNGTTIAGLTSEGGRFEIQQAGGELAEILLEPEPDVRFRTSAPATILRTGDQLSASGVVSTGTDDLDITIDIGATTVVAEARTCLAADRL